MERRHTIFLLILVLIAAIVWIDLPSNVPISIGSYVRQHSPSLGLDLRGGLQVLLKPPAGTTIDPAALTNASVILSHRVNGLGVSEVTFQVAGGQYIVGEFPGLQNQDEVLKLLQQTGQLEFVAMGNDYQPEGTQIQTKQCASLDTSTTPQLTETPVAAVTETPAAVTETPAAQATTTPAVKGPYCIVMTGKDLKDVSVMSGTTGGYGVNFTLTDAGSKVFGDFTSKHVNEFLAIVLDGTIISDPQIQSAITGGQGTISGKSFTAVTANNLSVTLKYGQLPVALEVAESRLIGPTLGEDSLKKSLLACLIGFAIVMVFMAIYYRLPGVIADIAILIYAGITYAIFLLLPVTLTLPGIAGFLLSTGSALDANILIFERLKEELRAGRTLGQAIDLGWRRAWPSIRDSNIATIITSIILFWFGSQYGASMVKGFALTLVIGVVVSLFCAIVITRNFLNNTVDIIKPNNHERWFGA
jgi:preprotein translocase subunit SecD